MMEWKRERGDVDDARSVRRLVLGIVAATIVLTALLVWLGSGNGGHRPGATQTPSPAKESADDKQLRKTGEEVALEGLLLAPSPPAPNP